MLPTFDGDFTHPLIDPEGTITNPSTEWTDFYAQFETERTGLSRAIMEARSAIIGILAQGSGIVIKSGQYHPFPKEAITSHHLDGIAPFERIIDRALTGHILIDVLSAHSLHATQRSMLFEKAQVWLIRKGLLHDVVLIPPQEPLPPVRERMLAYDAIALLQIGVPDAQGKIVNMTQAIRPGAAHISGLFNEIVENHLQRFGINGDQTLPGRIAHAIMIEIASINSGYTTQHIELARIACTR